MDVKTFRDNLFAMNTRRFGRVAEILVKSLIQAKDGNNIYHDLLDKDDRIEVKFSRAERKHPTKIEEGNVLEVVMNEGVSARMFYFDEYSEVVFDSNIQQIKPDEFDVLFYGLLFADRISIFVMESRWLKWDASINYSSKQHKGNTGEGQFHLTQKTLPYHLEKYHLLHISYYDAMQILRHLPKR